MAATSTNYYGYDRETYRDCLELIRDTNRRHLKILNIWFIIINVFCLILSFLGLFKVNQSGKIVYLIYAAIAIACLVINYIFEKIGFKKFQTIRMILNLYVWVVYGIQLSVEQPYMAATMYLIVLVVISLSFITTMCRMVFLSFTASAVFVYTSYVFKPATIAVQDLYNTLIMLTLCVILHFAIQRTKIEQFVTFQKNIQIQRELEIKSSFDALTSLLNRGRFFSLAGNILKEPHEDYMAICLLDLDEFKQINDKLGHQMGDKAIQIAGSIIIDTLDIDMKEKWSFQDRVVKERGSFPGRLGGDEFIVFVRGKSGREEVTGILQNMLTALNSVHIGDLHGIHASFGVTEIRPGDDIDSAYKRADEALYESKRAGKNQIRFNNAD